MEIRSFGPCDPSKRENRASAYRGLTGYHDGDEQATIAANYLRSDTPLWFTLADCIASKLLTGKPPRIVEAVAFAPGPVQSDLRPINVNGNPLYRVDPVKDDLFRRVIELRKATQARMASASGDEREALDTEQHALKICANSTSYGIWMQVNVAKRAKRFTATIYGHDGKPFTRETDKAEKPGEYFHPLLASLITGAARLMLAITECQIEAKGLEWAFCDTDSMAIAKPDTLNNVPDSRTRDRICIFLLFNQDKAIVQIALSVERQHTKDASIFQSGERIAIIDFGTFDPEPPAPPPLPDENGLWS